MTNSEGGFNRKSNDQQAETDSLGRMRELYLRAILDNFPFLVWLKDKDSRFLAVNKRFAEACGIDSPDAVRGLSDHDVWPSNLAEQYRADDWEVIGSQSEKIVEEPCQIGDQTHWIETFKKPVITPDGMTLGTVGFARDITVRKEMERQLAESEERWELAIAGTNDGIWDWNLETNAVYFSDRWKDMLGYAPDEIDNDYKEWESRIHPDDIQRVLNAINRHMANGSDVYQEEFRIRCKTGNYRWILARGKAIRNKQGKPTRFLGSHSDIHERIMAERRLHLRTAQLNSIFALSPDGFIAFGENGTVEYASRAFEVLTGLSSHDVIGKSEIDLIHSLSTCCAADSVDNRRALALLCAPSTPKSELQPAQRILIEFSAPRRIIEVGRIHGMGNVVSQIFYFRDVTRETEIDQLKSEFLSTAAHELRTPMVSIYGFSELLLNNTDFDAETTRELIETIHRQSVQMSSIINELLDLTRIEARRGLDFDTKPLDLNGLVSEVVHDFKYAGDSRTPTITLSGEQAEIVGDQRKLTQAIANVLSNAYKYSPDGGEISINVSAKQFHRPGYAIDVTDHGIGMSQDTLPKVCERFFRADSSGSILGTGLGMSIVKEIVALHGGQLNISSSLGIGTNVSIWLPQKSD